jgi:hypothetical protein
MNRSIFTPTQSTLCLIVKSIINAETEPDEVLKKEVEYIYEHTDKSINVGLPIVEVAVFRNLDKGLNRTVTFGQKEFTIAELYTVLDGIRWKLVDIVIKIVKKYSVEMPIEAGIGMGFGMNFLPQQPVQPTQTNEIPKI